MGWQAIATWDSREKMKKYQRKGQIAGHKAQKQRKCWLCDDTERVVDCSDGKAKITLCPDCKPTK